MGRRGRPNKRTSIETKGRICANEGQIMAMYLKGISAAEIAKNQNIPITWVERTINDNLAVWESENNKELNWKVEFYGICRSVKRKVRKMDGVNKDKIPC